MLIKSLEQMEGIVSSDRTLSWDGWDVVQSFNDPTAWGKKNGALIKGRWYSQKRFILSENGWHLPEKLVRK
jgi:hypothetical protein